MICTTDWFKQCGSPNAMRPEDRARLPCKSDEVCAVGTAFRRNPNPHCESAFRRSACQKSFDKLVDGGASSPARCRASNLRFEPSAVSPRAKPENPKGFQPPCHPLQSPLKIEDFSGAEPARKRFFLWKMGFSDAKTVPCPRCIFALPFLWKSGSKWSRALPGRKGCGPLELSWVF